nr:MAG TPA: hypothetical protein [Caudoviricetes sp.]
MWLNIRTSFISLTLFDEIYIIMVSGITLPVD